MVKRLLALAALVLAGCQMPTAAPDQCDPGLSGTNPDGTHWHVTICTHIGPK